MGPGRPTWTRPGPPKPPSSSTYDRHMSWLEQAHSEIRKLVHAQAPPAAAMEHLLSWCAAKHPHAGWARFKRLGINAELPRLERWLRGVLRSLPPAKSITAFWFGLFNPVDDDGTVRSDVYVSGSRLFAGDVDAADWNCAPAYWPESRYAKSRVLAAIYARAYEGPAPLGNDAEYPLVLGYAAFAVAHLCRTLPPELLLAGVQERAVIVGFDDGDMIPIGVVRSHAVGHKPTRATRLAHGGKPKGARRPRGSH